ncbi:DUF3093 domain-containing protein [Brachybacterium endophyticum]|uniref:DUF3093 domain-containing protein n=1 Tax=Brachybacterium endophyticum TaxID=2182385 RepID=A0A2U2RIZ6_9MICO|nr:DUF3093 domain-containing protein [Brachybacterium endophyticum]PWH05833.1 DUF3093 domain-containing protein [Brachybacterium endophyticum]
MSDASSDHTAPPSSDLGDPDAADAVSAGEILHRERLLPSVGTWIVGIAFGSVLGVILVPLSHFFAILTGILGIASMCLLLVLASPVIEVVGDRLRAGRAEIPVGLLGEPEVLGREGWEDAMSRGFEPLAFHLTRGWVHSGIRVPVLDEQDPAPAWVLSSRRPEDLALALRTARQG